MNHMLKKLVNQSIYPFAFFAKALHHNSYGNGGFSDEIHSKVVL